MHVAGKVLLGKMAWKFYAFTFEIWSCGKRMLLFYSCRCCANRTDQVQEAVSLPRGSRKEEKNGREFAE